jgi:hypothetical protein
MGQETPIAKEQLLLNWGRRSVGRLGVCEVLLGARQCRRQAGKG